VVNLFVAVAPGRPFFLEPIQVWHSSLLPAGFGDVTKVVFIFSSCSCYVTVIMCTHGPSDAVEYKISRLEAPDVSQLRKFGGVNSMTADVVL
jgi:hypothetical protein